MKIKTNKKCVCKKKIIKNSNNTISFKNLPITEIFTNKYKKSQNLTLNQELVFCNNCEHMSLTKIIDPFDIYNKNYLTSSTSSFSARYSNDIFCNFILKNLNKKKKYKKILEIGTNDLYLLKKFSKKAKKLVGIDPVINKKDKSLKNFHPIKGFFTEIDNKKIGHENNIVISGHTLEHVDDPELFLKKTISLADKNTKIFFQFPSAESLINNCSFDQVHHQHLNYFSLKSFSKLLKKCGGKIIDYDYHELHFGVLMVLFTRKSSKVKQVKKINLKKRILPSNFIQSYRNFKTHLATYKHLIERYIFMKKKFYIVGAGLMLPIINYHLGGLINKANGILDDDPNKINKYFLDINTKIISLKKTNLKKAICLVGTISSGITTRKLTSILEKKQAEIILIPTLTF